MSRKWWLTVIWVTIGLVCLLLLCPCFQKVRIDEGWQRSGNSMKQIGLALCNYYDDNGHLPPAVVRDKDGRPLYSWRVLLLPYIEQVNLYQQFNLNESWDSEHNKALIDKMPRVYSNYGSDGPGLTRFQVFTGPGTAFERPELTWADFPDGRGSTLLVVEAGNPVLWSKPEDIEYDPAGPLPQLGGVYTKPVHFLCWPVARKPGFIACFADGSVRFIRNSADEHLIRAIITRNGGEPVNVSDLE
jgi:hypothetical protein